MRWFLLALVALAVPAEAQSLTGPGLEDAMHARNLAMGGAFRAMGYGAEAITGNPAAMSLYKRYQMELSGSWDMPLGYGLGTAAISDSLSSDIAAGVAYDFVTYGALDRRWAHLTTFALAMPLSQMVHLGASVRHQIITGATNTNSITAAAGLVVRPVTFLTIGLSAHNLLPNYNRDLPRYFAGSVSMLLFGQLTPCFDVRADFNTGAPRFAWHGGVEWLLAMSYPLRAGYERDDITGHQYVSGGVGIFDEGSGVDFAYRQELGGDGGRMIAMTLKLQM
jgi:hypothetical protein